MADPLLAAAVRLVHVLAMAVVVGGTGAVAVLLHHPSSRQTLTASALLGFERGFWAAAGLLVLTGVGNIGTLADGFPDVASLRGKGFLLKFALVFVLVLQSIVRTLVVSRVAARDAPLTEPGRKGLRSWYGGTGLLGGVVVALAVILAHGGL